MPITCWTRRFANRSAIQWCLASNVNAVLKHKPKAKARQSDWPCRASRDGLSSSRDCCPASAVELGRSASTGAFDSFDDIAHPPTDPVLLFRTAAFGLAQLGGTRSMSRLLGERALDQDVHLPIVVTWVDVIHPHKESATFLGREVFATFDDKRLGFRQFSR